MSKKKRNIDEVTAIAREKFQFDELRPGQREAIDSLLAGQDTLVVQPTGSGKSAIYQIAGLLIEGSTLIVSPLIALQKDQADSIQALDAAPAAIVNSAQKVAENREALESIEEGEIEYIFLAPEQLRKPETLETLKAGGVSLFVVDEAHCISEWGHDFRPDYMQLGSAIEYLGHPTVLAMTATASEEVRQHIIARLGMRKPKVLVRSMDRPNIALRVDRFSSESEKMEALVKRASWADKPGIIYTGTRKKAEEIMGALAEEGVRALFYHAGLKAKDRAPIQEEFMSGGADVIVATTAFGMGVDKANVRFVYHYDVGDSLDSYYQEIGRAGRDGEKAEAVLFFRPEDIGSLKYRTGQGKLETEKVEQLTEVLAQKDGPVDVEEIAEKTELSRRKLESTLHRLEEAGVLETLPGGEVALANGTDPAEAAQAAVEEQQRYQEGKRERLQKMRDYAETLGCRREYILEYFGEEYRGPCNNCDNCLKTAGEIIVDESVGTRREVT